MGGIKDTYHFYGRQNCQGNLLQFASPIRRMIRTAAMAHYVAAAPGSDQYNPSSHVLPEDVTAIVCSSFLPILHSI